MLVLNGNGIKCTRTQDVSQISTYNRWDASADDVVRLIVPTAMLTRG